MVTSDSELTDERYKHPDNQAQTDISLGGLNDIKFLDDNIDNSTNRTYLDITRRTDGDCPSRFLVVLVDGTKSGGTFYKKIYSVKIFNKNLISGASYMCFE